MRSRGSKMSKIDVEPQWKPRRNRRNRKWREGPRKMRALSAKIIKLLEDDDLNGCDSPCSVVSYSLSMDNRIEDTYENSEWIRTAHIKTPALNEHDRRSPLFTGRMPMRNDFLDDIRSRRGEISYDEFPSEVGRNPMTSRLSIRDRLEPPKVRTEPPEFDIPPRSESPGMDIHHRLESSNISIQQRMGAPMAIRSRESVGFLDPPQPESFHQNQQDNEPAPRQHPRDEYNAYDADSLLRNQFSQPQRPCYFRGSLYFPSGYTCQPNQDTVRRQRPRWPWFKTSDDSSENLPDYSEHYMSRKREDYNDETFARDPYIPPGGRHYEQSEYNRSQCSQYFDHIGSNLREPRSEMSLSAHQLNNYSDYQSESYEIDYNNRRDDGQFNWSYSQVECYGSGLSPRRFYNSRPRPLPYSSVSPHHSVMDTPRFRSLMDSPLNNWEGPLGRSYYSSYQNRISDEDFTDSDQQDSEVEEFGDNSKKRIREFWKDVIKERGILISRDGTSAAMTRESGEYAKKILIEKASDLTKFPKTWKPRFLRTGLVHRSGLYQIICKDFQTVLWTLKQEIPPFEGNGFKILKRPYDWDCGPVRISLWLSLEPANPQDTLQNLEVENPGIGATNWSLVSVSVEDGWRQFVADVGRESAIYLETNGWTVLYWNNLLPVNRLRNATKQLFFNQLAGDNP